MNILMEGLKIKDEKVAAKRAAVMAPEKPSVVTETDLSRPAEKVTQAEREAAAAAAAARPSVVRPARKKSKIKLVVAAGAGLAALGGFVIAAGLASLLSGPFWGRFADRSSRLVMATASAVAAGMGGVIFLAAKIQPGLLESLWFLPGAYFILSVAHEGVRVGRKTYVVNLGTGNQRTDYVAISNTVIGVLLLVVGSVGLLTPLVGNDGVIGVLALMGAVGTVMSWTLKEV
jgi:hypothetical protein